MEGDEPRAVEVSVTSLIIPTRKLYVLVRLALMLEQGGTVTMVACASDRRAGLNLASPKLVFRRSSPLR